MMMEKNNREVLQPILEWIGKVEKSGADAVKARGSQS